ncbi:MAG: phosphatase PAP2 family protein [Candidatus Methylomirabilia bacterium]
MIRHYLFIDYVTQGYILVVGLLVLFFHDQTVPGWGWLIGAHLMLLFLVHRLLRACGRGRGGGVVDFLRHFYPVLLYAAFYRESGMLSQMFVSGHLDPVVIRWEQALFGFQPSMLFMARLPWLPVSELFYASYFSYYIMIAGVGLTLFLRRREAFFHYVSVLSFVFYICYLIYIFLPVIGPRVFSRSLGGYSLPHAVQALVDPALLSFPPQVTRGPFFRIMALIYDVFEAPGAALPSSHVAASICTVWFSFRYRLRIRHVHLVMVVLLCFSTIYCRYHYVIDVLAGLLTVAVLVPLGNWLFSKYHEPQGAGSGGAAASEAGT